MKRMADNYQHKMMTIQQTLSSVTNIPHIKDFDVNLPRSREIRLILMALPGESITKTASITLCVISVNASRA